jgi:hypothetical protein
MTMALFDLSQLSFDEFVCFFFDHDVDKEEYWYREAALENFHCFDDDDTSSPEVVVGHMTRLFTKFASIASQYSLQQINAGIWAMFTYGGFVVQKHLWLEATPLPERLACIRSMYSVYSDFVAKSTVEVLEGCFHMWWDDLASSFWTQMHSDNKVADGDTGSLTADQRALLDTMFETLSKILALPDDRTQAFALHGLGHLHHPSVRKLVQQYLDDYRSDMTPEGVKWVERCRDGTVM